VTAADPVSGPQLLLGRGRDATGLRVLVAGLGASGAAAAQALLATGADVTGCDAATELSTRAVALRAAGARLVLGAAAADPAVLAEVDLVVTSPGWRPSHPVLAEAQRFGMPVWSEAELAWRLRDPAGAPWLCVTGTNGKTTTVGLLAGLLDACGIPAIAAGNIGLPLVDAIDAAVEVLAVELSSFQLHYTHSTRPLAAACLNVAADHLDWHGSYQAYRSDKARVYERTTDTCVYTVDDPQTEVMVRAADVAPGCRAVGVTLGAPAPGMLGVVDEVLVDRAFGPDISRGARELATLDDVRAFAAPAGDPDAAVAPHTVSNVLVAMALACSAGTPVERLAAALREQRAPGHRGETVAQWGGLRFVDDSKATNPHAADAAMRGAVASREMPPGSDDRSIVWIAGGQAKGARFEEVARRHGARLRAAVLIGVDADVVGAALARHAPHVHQVRVDPADTGEVAEYMDRVVAAAVRLARPGDTILLAPGAASLDQFSGYAQRGEAFRDAVTRRAGPRA